jgi:hypothetical protein
MERNRPPLLSTEDDVTIQIHSPTSPKQRSQLRRYRFIEIFLNALYNFVPALLVLFTIFTILAHSYDAIYLIINGNAIRAKMHIKQPHEIQSLSNGTAKYTVFEVSRDRFAYKDSLPGFQRKIPNGNPAQVILFDIESEPALTLPVELRSQKNSHLIRKQPSGNRGKFSIWDSFVFAMNHIETERVFYFDNCNYPLQDFKYDTYMKTDVNYYFPNNERYYTQNFFAHRDDIVRFLSELPLIMIQDPRSFFGGDQLMIWYLYSYRAPDKMGHIHHEALAEYTQWNAHSIVIQRMFLYMNRYGTPVGGIGNMHSGWCNDKRPICSMGGFLRRFLALPIIWHFVDAALRLEVLFWLVYTVVNYTGSWVLGFAVAITVSFIVLSVVYDLLKRLVQKKTEKVKK